MKAWRGPGIGRADGRDVSEKAVQLACRRLLRTLGYRTWDTSQPFRAAITPGVPDIIAIRAGAPILFVEAKSARGRVTAAQQLFLDTARAAGAQAVVAHSAAELAAALGLEVP